MPTWVIIGASRGIGLEFVRQLLAHGDQVIAAIRDQYMASQLWQVAAGAVARPGACQLFECDVTSETSIAVRVSSPRVPTELTLSRLSQAGSQR
jgi:NAD(P)-dependent dehydrogenase (short-subunit alcohol dehydrogenase family)